MKKVLITGSAGFIGHHLVIQLAELGYEVVGLDNLNNYYDVSLKHLRLEKQGFFIDQIGQEIIQSSQKYSNVFFMKGDLGDENFIDALFASQSFELVFNLAAQAGVRYSIEKPRTYIESNISGFLNILESCAKHGVAHLYYASSSSVYGLNEEVPFSTEQKTDRPASLYAATKKSNELMAHAYSHLYNLNTTGLRFFTVYGPMGRPDMAYFLFAKAIMDNMPIKVFNHGQLERDFTYIDDIIESITTLITKKASVDELSMEKARVFNIGSDRPTNLMDFIGVIENALEKRAVIDFQPMQKGDVYATWADVTKLEREIGYKINSTPLETGINNFISWFKIFHQKQ